MNNSNKISVLVPVYNTKDYLRECIESILNQTYQNFELILVDDGSTDGSGDICDEYVTLNNKIKVLHKQNEGLVLARRSGIRMATGDFVMFLDSDDCYRPDALEIINKNVNKHACDLIFFNASKKEEFISKDWILGFNDEQVFEDQDKNLLYEKLITSAKLNNLCFKAIKRELIDADNDYKKFAFVTSAEDLLQSLPIIDSCKKALYVDEALYFYRQHGNSMVHNFTYKSYVSIKTVHDVLLNYIYKWNKQEYIEMHNAGRINVVVRYAKNIILGTQCKKEKINALKELAEDEYFINAYNNFDKSSFKGSDLRLIRLLIKRKIKSIYLLLNSKNKAKKVVRLLLGKR